MARRGRPAAGRRHVFEADEPGSARIPRQGEPIPPVAVEPLRGGDRLGAHPGPFETRSSRQGEREGSAVRVDPIPGRRPQAAVGPLRRPEPEPGGQQGRQGSQRRGRHLHPDRPLADAGRPDPGDRRPVVAGPLGLVERGAFPAPPGAVRASGRARRPARPEGTGPSLRGPESGGSRPSASPPTPPSAGGTGTGGGPTRPPRGRGSGDTGSRRRGRPAGGGASRSRPRRGPSAPRSSGGRPRRPCRAGRSGPGGSSPGGPRPGGGRTGRAGSSRGGPSSAGRRS